MTGFLRKLVLGGTIGGLLSGYYLLRELPLPSATGPPYQRLAQQPYSQHPNKHFLTREPRSVGIIGAGSAGLTTAKVLSQQGYLVEVLEKRQSIGGVWAENYQDSALQGPFPHYHIPDFPFPADTPLFPKQPQVLEYLQSYVEAFHLKPLVSLNSKVTEVQQGEDGSWTVTLKTGVKKHYDFLVFSPGHFSRPYVPDIPGLASFQGKSLHSFHVRNAKELFAGKRVVVVGGSKSAYDMMTLGVENGGQVTAVMREIMWTTPVTGAIYGRGMMAWMTCRLSEILNPAPYEPKTWLNWGLFHLGSIYWGIICRETAADLPDFLKPTNDYRTQRNRVVNARDSKLFPRLAKKEVTVVTGSIEQITPQGPVVNGTLIPADVLVFATGFQPTSLGLAGKEETFWLYRGVLDPRIRNFAVIGYGNIIYNQVKFSLQAAWLCDVLRGAVALPSTEAMQTEVQDFEAALRQAYGKDAPHYAYAWSEFRYFDKLLGDMHVQARRKKSLYEDLVGLPDPLDYKLVLTHRV